MVSLEFKSMAISRFPVLQRPSSSPAMAVALPSIASIGPRRRLFPICRGLKISTRSTLKSATAVSGEAGGRKLRRGAVVCEAQSASVQVPSVTESSWKSLVLEGDQLVLVLFSAPWCGPCRAVYPAIAEISAEFSGKIKCYQLNTDDNKEIASTYGIRSIPTILFFKNGEKKDVIIGSVPKTTLVASLEKLL